MDVYEKRQAEKQAREDALQLAVKRCRRLPGFTVPNHANAHPVEGGHFVEVSLWVPTPSTKSPEKS